MPLMEKTTCFTCSQESGVGVFMVDLQVWQY